MVVDCTTNTGYDGTNEAYTGGASDDGTGRGNGKIAEPNGEGREGIPELLRDAGNSHGAQASEGLVGNWNPSGGTQVLRGSLNVSPETQAAVEWSGATPIELKS